MTYPKKLDFEPRQKYMRIIPNNSPEFLKNIDIKTIVDNCADVSLTQQTQFIKEYCDLSRHCRQPINWINTVGIYRIFYELNRFRCCHRHRIKLLKTVMRSSICEDLKTRILKEIEIYKKLIEIIKEFKPIHRANKKASRLQQIY